MCASLRRPPECNKQRMPAATPHVGQGTENNCFAVRSLVLIWIGCDKTSRRTVPFGTLCAPAIENCRSYRTFVGDKASHRLMDPMPRSTAFVGNARLILGDSQPTRKTPQQAPGLLVGLGLFAARSLRQGIPTAKNASQSIAGDAGGNNWHNAVPG